MNKRSLIVLLFFVLLLISKEDFAKTSADSNSHVTAVPVNANKSYIEWIGKKVLGQHSGKVKLQSGTINNKNGVLTGGEFVIDMKSLTNDDMSDADYKKKLIDHLSSEDFFNVAGFPAATLKITKVLKMTKKENSYSLTGDLTIKGITKSITFPATFSAVGKGFEGNASLTIDRSLWDVKYGSSSFFEGLGDKAISNEMELNVHVFTN